jgi:hypothetical protein
VTDLTTGSSYLLPGAGSCGVDNDTAERPLDPAFCPPDTYLSGQPHICALGNYGDDEWYQTSDNLGSAPRIPVTRSTYRT